MTTAYQTLNPYRDLFGIAAERPHYYELLGLPPFVAAADEIQAAGMVRLKQLDPPPQGISVGVCKQVAAEILAALDCLSRPATKNEYDLRLRRDMVLSPQQRTSLARTPALHGGYPVAPAASSTKGSAANTFRDLPLQPPAMTPLAQRPDVLPVLGKPYPPAVSPHATGGPLGDSLHPHPNYEPAQLLAKGRCHKVFEAFEIKLGRKVAIKQLDTGVTDQQVSLFWREAQFLAARGHQNIVTILGSDEQRGWIIAELMAGNVELRIAKGPMEPDLVRAVLRQTLEGLAHFHRQGRIHGEIKPANLLVDDQGYVKLNASPGFQTSEEFRAPLGCQRHVAPELLNSKVFGEVGPAVDFYCLGFTMLELLVGPGIESLFRGVSGEGKERDIAWLRWHHSHTETLPSLRQLVPDAPDDLVAVLDRLMAKRVSQRFQHAEEALNALENGPLLRIPLDTDAHLDQDRRQGLGAVIKGKPPAHREFAEQQEKSKTLLYQVANSPYIVSLRAFFKRPAIRYFFFGLLLLFALLVLFSPSGPRTRPVRIESVPPGATVTIDGKAIGIQTPRDLDLAVGHHVLEFDLPGYDKGQLAVDIEKRGDAGPYICPLTKINEEGRRTSKRTPSVPCTVTVDSIPPGASIYLEGAAVPGARAAEPMQTPGHIQLTEGAYRVEMRLDGYKPSTQTLKVCAGKDNHFQYELERERIENPEKTVDGSHQPTDPDPPAKVDVVVIPDPLPPPQKPPVKATPVTQHIMVPYRWPLPRYISTDEQARFFQQVHLILSNVSWTGARADAFQTAATAFDIAQSIHPGDPRLHFAYGIFLQKRLAFADAKVQFEIARELEQARQRQYKASAGQGIVPDDVLFPAAWRQLVRIHLARREWDRATTECLELVENCMQSHKTIQRFAAAGKPTEYETVTFDILHENVRFAGHAFGYMKHHHLSNTSVFAGKPLDRTGHLLESRLDVKDYRQLFRAAFDEAGYQCAKAAGNGRPAAVALSTSDGPSGALEDLASSLELERNLMQDAINEGLDSMIGAIGANARSKMRDALSIR